jgi:hypothetical protein
LTEDGTADEVTALRAELATVRAENDWLGVDKPDRTEPTRSPTIAVAQNRAAPRPTVDQKSTPQRRSTCRPR